MGCETFFDANSTLSVSVDELCDLHAHYGFAGALVHADASDNVSIDQANERLAAACREKENLHFSWLLTPGAAADAQLAAMKAVGAKAARFLPKRYNFTVDRATCGPLLVELAKQRIPTFLDGGKLAWSEQVYDWDEIARVCREFPDLPLILTRCAGLDPLALYRLWEGGANLYAETSYYVTPDGVADAARHGFADRLLLGSGLPTWEAACPLTQLRLADIDDEAFAAIAGNTLRRLLGLPLGAASEQRGVKHGLRIIDAHGHFGTTDSLYNPVVDAEALVAAVRRNGVSRIYVTPLRRRPSDTQDRNEALATVLRAYPRELSGYFRVDLDDPAGQGSTMVRAIDQWGMIGLKLHCAWAERSIEHPDFVAALQFADQRRLPVLVHSIDRPEAFARICANYPDLRILVAHNGGTDSDDAAGWMEMIRRTPNCYLDMCWSRCYRGALRRVVDAFGPEKLLFATDFVFKDQSFELGRLLGADLPHDVKQQLAFDNAIQFYEPSNPTAR